MDEQMIKEYARLLGRKGGNKTKEKGKEYYSEIGKKGMAIRWKKHREAKELQGNE